MVNSEASFFGAGNETVPFPVHFLISPIWLKYFRYGPAEWLWRSLTYGHPQPMWVGAGMKPASPLPDGLQ